jgi:hypothetical protein
MFYLHVHACASMPEATFACNAHLLGAFTASVCQKQFAKKSLKMEILTVQDIGPFFTHLAVFLDFEELV